MRKLLTFLIAVAAIVFAVLSPAGAQMMLTGAGCATVCGGGGGAFQGSGDVVGSAFAYWSCGRAYTAAYATGGGNACDIIRTSDSATCTVKFATTGFADVATSYCNSNTQSVTAFCNATTCKVTKAYDQSGATNCTTACDVTQATDANRPILNLAGLGSKVCMTSSGSQSLNTPLTSILVSQPLSMSAVAERTGATSSFSDIIGNTDIQFMFNQAPNQGGVYAGTIGTALQVAMADNSYHALNVVVNGSSSVVAVDGSATTGLSPGSDTLLLGTILSLGNGNNPLTGVICEARVDAIGYNATQYGNMNTNQHSSTNGYNF